MTFPQASHPLFPFLVVATLVAASLAGCLNNGTTREDPVGDYLVSREYTVAVDPDTWSKVARATDPETALKELMVSTLVVRVAAAGDYVLKYTDKSGIAQERTLTGLEPGKPTTVRDVDPLTAATLLKEGAVKFERKAKTTEWWHKGDIPLGLSIEKGSKAAYAYRMESSSEFSLANLHVEEDGETANLANIEASVTMPVTGTFSYELKPTLEADGYPLDLAASLALAPSSSSVFLVSATGDVNGQPGTVGLDFSEATASLTANLRAWIRDGEPTRAQFRGGHVTFDPTITAWATGPFAEDAPFPSCANRTRDSNCRPTEIYDAERYRIPMDRDLAGDSAKSLDPGTPKVTSERDRKILSFVTRLFAEELVPGDALMLAIGTTADALHASGSIFEMGGSFVLEVVGEEDVTVPAGTFKAMKVTQTLRTYANIQRIADPANTTRTVVNPFQMDETVSRTTFWFATDTHQPLKVVSEFPLDLNALTDDILDALEARVWETSGVDPIQSDQVDWRQTGRYTLEATTLEGQTAVAPVVGYALATALTQGSSLALPAAIMSEVECPYVYNYGGYNGYEGSGGYGDYDPYAGSSYYGHYDCSQ